ANSRSSRRLVSKLTKLSEHVRSEASRRPAAAMVIHLLRLPRRPEQVAGYPSSQLRLQGSLNYETWGNRRLGNETAPLRGQERTRIPLQDVHILQIHAGKVRRPLQRACPRSNAAARPYRDRGSLMRRRSEPPGKAGVVFRLGPTGGMDRSHHGRAIWL